MKHNVKRIAVLCQAFLAVAVLLLGSVSLADETVAIMEVYSADNEIALYVQGVSETEIPTVLIGTSEVDEAKVQCQTVNDVGIETIVLIDNSLSIPTADRELIAELLQEILNAHASNEKIALATIDEHVNFVTDFTDNYATLKEAIEGITYQDQETYMTDVLYELLSGNFNVQTNSVFRRIIVVSDGVDNKTLGYTKDELNDLIKKNPYPIYAVGCQTSNNNDELESMFALSRLTNGESYLIEDDGMANQLLQDLYADREIVQVRIAPDYGLLDGSDKTVQISYSSATLSQAVTMPQLKEELIEVETETETETETEIETETETETETEEESEEEEKLKATITWILIGLIVIMLVLLIVMLALRSHKKSLKAEQSREKLMAQRESELKAALASNKAQGRILLTDIATNYSVQLSISQLPAVVGRNSKLCAAAFPYDKSVSGKHCELSFQNGSLCIRDLQSSNGTYVNGARIVHYVALSSGSIITIGELRIRVDIY